MEERGLLDRTLVVLASEFSRDMMIEGVPGSTAKDQSRAKIRHAQGADSLRPAPPLHRLRIVGAVCGGGMKRGFLYGETAPERPCLVTDKSKEISVTDLHATIFTAMGISPKTAFDVEKRPFYVTQGRQGGAGERVVCEIVNLWLWNRSEFMRVCFDEFVQQFREIVWIREKLFVELVQMLDRFRRCRLPLSAFQLAQPTIMQKYGNRAADNFRGAIRAYCPKRRNDIVNFRSVAV